jgi:hypothetical protein
VPEKLWRCDVCFYRHVPWPTPSIKVPKSSN